MTCHLPTLRTITLLHGNRLACLWASPCWHRNDLARTDMLDYGHRGWRGWPMASAALPPVQGRSQKLHVGGPGARGLILLLSVCSLLRSYLAPSPYFPSKINKYIRSIGELGNSRPLLVAGNGYKKDKKTINTSNILAIVV